MRKVNFWLISLLSVAATSCSLSNKAISSSEEISLRVRTSACFGTCPVYELKVENGLASYYGLKYPRTNDTLQVVISEIELDSIVYIFDTHKFWELEAEYDNPQISDLPSVNIELSHGKQKNRVEARAQIPNNLRNILEYIERMRLRTFAELKS